MPFAEVNAALQVIRRANVYVRDKNTKAPLADASVSIDGMLQGNTDSNGALTINRQYAGTHQLTISKDSYVDYMSTIDIKPGNSTFTIYLSKITSVKVALATSEWLCNSNRTALLNLARQVGISDIMIYFAASAWLQANWNWKMLQIDGHVNYFRSAGLAVWLSIGVYTLDESKGTAYRLQSYIDRYKGKIEGINFNVEDNVTQVAGYTIQDIQNWFVAKEQQLASNSMKTMYYNGDGASSGVGPPTDVDPVYLTNQGLILRAWLGPNGGWKPNTFQLREFWINYVILSPSTNPIAWPRGEGQTYDEIMNWYGNIVITRYNLKMNPGATALLWEVMNQQDMPGPAQINALKQVSTDWIAR
jgi:hypothetical protein